MPHPKRFKFTEKAIAHLPKPVEKRATYHDSDVGDLGKGRRNLAGTGAGRSPKALRRPRLVEALAVLDAVPVRARAGRVHTGRASRALRGKSPRKECQEPHARRKRCPLDA